jgi:hypothetical protein
VNIVVVASTQPYYSRVPTMSKSATYSPAEFSA